MNKTCRRGKDHTVIARTLSFQSSLAVIWMQKLVAKNSEKSGETF